MSKTTDTNFRQLLIEALKIVKSHKIFWLLGIISTLASDSRSGTDILFIHRALYWNGSPFSFLSALTLSEAPSEKLSTWLTGAGLAPLLTMSITLGVWLVHLGLQAGIIKAAVEAKQKRPLSITNILRFSFVNGWRVISLNLALFGLFYLVYLILRAILSQYLTLPSFDAEAELEWQYRSSFYQTIGSLLWWLLIPLNFAIILIIYPFAKRSVVLNKGKLVSALYYTIFIIRYNLLQLGKLFLVLVLLALLLEGVIDGLVNLWPAFRMLWPEQAKVVGATALQIGEHPLFLGIVQGLVILVGGYLAAVVSVFGTYLYLDCEDRYLQRVIAVPLTARLHQE